MLNSIRQRSFAYIVNTNGINERLRSHNSGICLQTSQPLYICPYSVFAYTCGFNGNQSFMF